MAGFCVLKISTYYFIETVNTLKHLKLFYQFYIELKPFERLKGRAYVKRSYFVHGSWRVWKDWNVFHYQKESI